MRQSSRSAGDGVPSASADSSAKALAAAASAKAEPRGGEGAPTGAGGGTRPPDGVGAAPCRTSGPRPAHVRSPPPPARELVEPSSGKRWLYDLERDPGELTDVAASHPDVAARLAALLARQSEQDRRLRGLIATTPHALELDEATLRELSALGYTGK